MHYLFVNNLVENVSEGKEKEVKQYWLGPDLSLEGLIAHSVFEWALMGFLIHFIP